MIMKKNILCFLVLSFITLHAQQIPFDYELGTSSLKKIADKNPASNTVERILINGNTIWLGTSNGLSKSTDNGVTWTNYYKTEAFGEESISAMDYNNGIIWAATWHSEEKLGSSVPVGTGLRYSTDEGITWNKVDQPVDAPGDSSIIYGINTLRALPVTAVEQNFIYDIAFTNNTVWIVSFAAGLRKSTDMGKTWQRVVLPPDNLNSVKPTDTLNFSLQPQSGRFGNESYLNHRAFSVLAVDDTTLYVGTAGGINKSTDGGVSWVKFNRTNQDNPISGNFILALDQNPFDKSIWAGTWKAEGATENWGLSYSFDGGENWNVALPGSRVMDFGFRLYGANGVYNSADIFAATQDGLFRSGNNGKTWIAANNIFEAVDQYSKKNVTTNHFRAVEADFPINNNVDIWVGTNAGGLLRYEDKDGTWSGKWNVYFNSGEQIKKNETFAFPNPFSPLNRVVRIKYKTEKSSEVSLRIFDFGMNLVKTIIQNAQRGISDEQMEIWDGRDEAGKIVPNGVYFYRIDIGSDEPLFGKIMVVM